MRVRAAPSAPLKLGHHEPAVRERLGHGKAPPARRRRDWETPQSGSCPPLPPPPPPCRHGLAHRQRKLRARTPAPPAAPTPTQVTCGAGRACTRASWPGGPPPLPHTPTHLWSWSRLHTSRLARWPPSPPAHPHAPVELVALAHEPLGQVAPLPSRTPPRTCGAGRACTRAAWPGPSRRRRCGPAATGRTGSPGRGATCPARASSSEGSSERAPCALHAVALPAMHPAHHH